MEREETKTSRKIITVAGCKGGVGKSVLAGALAIEAGSCGLPVVASNIQGLKDAVFEGETGYLVEEGDTAGFARMIRNMDLKKEEVRSCVNAEFDWSTIYQRYEKSLIKGLEQNV